MAQGHEARLADCGIRHAAARDTHAHIARAWAGVHDVVPAINTVLLRFDPLQNSGTALADQLQHHLEGES